MNTFIISRAHYITKCVLSYTCIVFVIEGKSLLHVAQVLWFKY